MKIERTKNATRNIVFSGMSQMMNMLVPFIMRSIILNFLGVEYLGLSGLFRSIFSILNLAELGVGSAMVYSMYKPIAEDDIETICALMKLYRTFYRIIGLVIMSIGLILTPFLPNLINGEVTADVNLYVLYFMNLGSTTLSYWLFAYKNSLLVAHQRDDIISKVRIVVHLIEYIFKIIVLIVFRNYYLFLILQIVGQAADNITVALVVTKVFPGYSPRGNLSKEQKHSIASRVRDLFTSNFSFVILNSADTLVISSFLGFTILAIYQNYYFIVSSLKTLVMVVIGACIAGIGNSMVTESAEKNYHDLKKMTILFGWLMGISSSILLCTYQPFIHLWMGEDNLLSFNYVICFVAYFYSIGMNQLINMFKDAAGIWKIDKWRPLTAALVNIGLDLILVQWIELYGVIFATIISIVVVQIPWLFHNLFKAVFPHKYLWEYIKLYCSFIIVSLFSCFVCWFVCSQINLGAWAMFFINAIISFIIANLIFFIVYGRNNLFKESVTQIIKVVLRKK
ncbi:MAG: oligosaccharide flippase family protein [Lachnospiraceae bacterium]|nr:oligosaccharide flippase family protein [Lachnospiraceae bacterium]